MKKRLTQYFVLTFAISWLLWLPSVLRSNVMPGLPEVVGLFGMFALLVPMIVTFHLISQESGWSKLKQFAKRAISLNFNKV